MKPLVAARLPVPALTSRLVADMPVDLDPRDGVVVDGTRRMVLVRRRPA